MATNVARRKWSVFRIRQALMKPLANKYKQRSALYFEIMRFQNNLYPCGGQVGFLYLVQVNEIGFRVMYFA